MFVVSDRLDAVLLGCFFFGLLFAAVSLLTGATRLHWRHGRVHVRHGRGFQPSGGHAALSPFNDSSLLAFVAWFGGVGYLARNAVGAPWPLALALGAVGGLGAGLLVFWCLATLAANPVGELDPEDFRLQGTIARVTSSIRADGVGEVVYEQGGARCVSAARAAHGVAIGRGTEVVVVQVERGTALVEPWAVFAGERHADLVPRPHGHDGAGDLPPPGGLHPENAGIPGVPLGILP